MAATAAPAIAYPPELPVSAHREELLGAIGSNQVVVVVDEVAAMYADFAAGRVRAPMRFE